MKNQLIIFSKNRACQLHLLLESIAQNAPLFFDTAAVLYKADADYITSYDRLKHDWKARCPIYFHSERHFQSDLLSLIDDRFEFTTFLVDDMVVFEPLGAAKTDILSWITAEAICFSLRLGKNCCYSHPANIHYQLGPHEEHGKFIRFSFREQPLSDFSYPLSSDGHTFQTHQLKMLLNQITFANPNTMESNLQFWLNFTPALVVAFSRSKAVSIPVNIVNDTHFNRHGTEYAYSLKELNDRYLKGEIIDLAQMDFYDIRGPHQEIAYVFKMRNMCL